MPAAQFPIPLSTGASMTTGKQMISILEDTIPKIEKWVEDRDYKGYEPADALNSILRPLAFGSLFGERLLIQIFKQSPVNLRGVLGVKPHDTAIGRGYMAGGYLVMSRLNNRQGYEEKAKQCLTWLVENKSPKFEEYSWGNHYDFASRSGKYSKFESIIVWTSIIGQTFLDAYELFGSQEYLDIAESVCRWILALPRERTERGVCISYLAVKQSSIHNSNMLGAAMLARTAKLTGNRECLELAREAMEYSCSRQLPDGAWYYGEASNQHWIDNFHTGYNLDSLRCYMESAEDGLYEDQLRKGLEFFKDHFFEAGGRPKYYHNRAYPIDIQCSSQAIETLGNLAGHDPDALNLALRVAKWTIDNMFDDSGYFYFRKFPYGTEKTPMLHWGQGTMYKALANLLSKLMVQCRCMH